MNGAIDLSLPKPTTDQQQQQQLNKNSNYSGRSMLSTQLGSSKFLIENILNLRPFAVDKQAQAQQQQLADGSNKFVFTARSGGAGATTGRGSHGRQEGRPLKSGNVRCETTICGSSQAALEVARAKSRARARGRRRQRNKRTASPTAAEVDLSLYPIQVRQRTMFSEWQLANLEWRFTRNKYLTTGDRIRVAKLLQLNQLQVKTWFQVSSPPPTTIVHCQKKCTNVYDCKLANDL